MSTNPLSRSSFRGKASAVYASTSVWHDMQQIRALRNFRGDVERAASNLARPFTLYSCGLSLKPLAVIPT
jgi:hypothetical protein